MNPKSLTKRRHQITRRIISSYSSWIVRLYCLIRFQIINLRMLEEIEQYMPKMGVILDVGCGFGLFSHYFSLCKKSRRMVSIDLNEKRIAMARRSAKILGNEDRTNFSSMNVLDYKFDQQVKAIVMLDIIHHLPKGRAEGIIEHCYKVLDQGGVLLIKDVEAKPRWKAFFTWVLDKMMDYKTPVNYYEKEVLLARLEEQGFRTYVHQMLDVLPYPHVFYICWKD